MRKEFIAAAATIAITIIGVWWIATSDQQDAALTVTGVLLLAVVAGVLVLSLAASETDLARAWPLGWAIAMAALFAGVGVVSVTNGLLLLAASMALGLVSIGVRVVRLRQRAREALLNMLGHDDTTRGTCRVESSRPDQFR